MVPKGLLVGIVKLLHYIWQNIICDDALLE